MFPANGSPACSSPLWRGTVSLFAIVVVGVALFDRAHRGDPPKQTADIEQEIRAFLGQWNDAIARGDAERVRAAYTDDNWLGWFEDGELRYHTPDDILAALAQFPPATKINTTISDVRAHTLGDRRAHASARFRTRLDFPDGEFAFEGVFTAILERTDNRWRFLGGHTSTRRPELAPNRPEG